MQVKTKEDKSDWGEYNSADWMRWDCIDFDVLMLCGRAQSERSEDNDELLIEMDTTKRTNTHTHIHSCTEVKINWLIENYQRFDSFHFVSFHFVPFHFHSNSFRFVSTIFLFVLRITLTPWMREKRRNWRWNFSTFLLAEREIILFSLYFRSFVCKWDTPLRVWSQCTSTKSQSRCFLQK